MPIAKPASVNEPTVPTFTVCRGPGVSGPLVGAEVAADASGPRRAAAEAGVAAPRGPPAAGPPVGWQALSAPSSATNTAATIRPCRIAPTSPASVPHAVGPTLAQAPNGRKGRLTRPDRWPTLEARRDPYRRHTGGDRHGAAGHRRRRPRHRTRGGDPRVPGRPLPRPALGVRLRRLPVARRLVPRLHLARPARLSGRRGLGAVPRRV